MKIKKRLILSFVIITIISSIAGIVGLFVMQISDANYSSALVSNGFSQGDIGRFNTYLNKGSALVRDMIFLTDEEEMQSTRQELDGLIGKVNEAFDAMKVSCRTPEEIKQLEVIEKNLPGYQELREQVIQLGMENKNQEALVLFRQKARPLLNTCMKAADTLAEMNVTMGTQASKDLSVQFRISVQIIVAIIIITFIVSILLGTRISHSISRPIHEIEAAAKEMAQGKLKANITYNSKNELGSLSDNMRTMIQRISAYMDEITSITKQLSEGDLDVRRRESFLGDFGPVQTSLRSLIESLNYTLRQINESADQVSCGSEQVATGAQALSQGAVEQAGSVQDLVGTIKEIAEQINASAQNAAEARDETQQAGTAITTCNTQMQEMIESMNEISGKSSEIEKIIKTIEDIAFQTNILALNASVEAVRAGEAGKGFAVVAGEVRSLAGKSAEAAKNTSNLISGSIKAVEEGTKIARETAESLIQVVQGAQKVAATVGKIADEADEQKVSIAKISQEIDHISGVVQTNSATAEESAAASEELSGQAQLLKELVGRFNLKPDTESPAAVLIDSKY